jgi:hypothetical protein
MTEPRYTALTHGEALDLLAECYLRCNKLSVKLEMCANLDREHCLEIVRQGEEIMRLRAALEASPWHSVEDKPTEYAWVMAGARIPNDSTVGYWERAVFTEYRLGEFRDAEWATHWMPVPSLPKESG